jgi:hypothetical protein
MSFAWAPAVQARPCAVSRQSKSFHGDRWVALGAQLLQNLIDNFPIDTGINRPAKKQAWGSSDTSNANSSTDVTSGLGS